MEHVSPLPLIYPKTEEFPVDKKLEYYFNEDLTLGVFAFDCELVKLLEKKDPLIVNINTI